MMIFRHLNLNHLLVFNEGSQKVTYLFPKTGERFCSGSKNSEDSETVTDNRQVFTVKNLLEASVDGSGLNASVYGWISGHRKQKENTFVDVVDGSCFRHLQVVLRSNAFDSKTIDYGASVAVHGKLLPSNHPKQNVEFLGEKVEVIGNSDADVYPIKVKVRHDPEYIRNSALPYRHRTNAGAAMLKVRNAASMAFHDFFQKDNFLLVNTPLITSNDCEGAGEVFRLHASGDGEKGEDGIPRTYFHKDVYLTVSGQLHLEAMVQGLRKVYTFGPTFRADGTSSRVHLAEFYMIEAEMAFITTVKELCDLIERMVKTVTESLLNSCAEELNLYHKHVAKSGLRKSIENLIKTNFELMSYSDAFYHLRKKEKFQDKEWGSDLTKEMERYLVTMVGNKPLFITNFPASLKPFYAKGNSMEDPKTQTSASLDLLLPEVGEVCGGTLREHHYQKLMKNMEQKGMLTGEHIKDDHALKWFTELRNFGTVPHGGFGLGFERYLQYVLGIDNIRECIPFPRSEGKCLL